MIDWWNLYIMLVIIISSIKTVASKSFLRKQSLLD